MKDHASGCHCSSSSSGCNQSLDELEFERGIWQAALDDDVDRLASLTAKGADINRADSSGFTALHYASRNGNLRSVTFLLERGASVYVTTNAGKDTPLHRAAYCGHANLVQLLLRYGADALKQNVDGQTAYHKACERGHRTIVQLLEKHSPSIVNIKDNKQRTGNDLILTSSSD